ncbi:hypothetical protein CALVIDRAFT_530306 [Calocera viscosa TUFC12733]|uniref:Uncharacterized protein n=1 Tax=Calocera viscosa (strain TUFC12733) TaxID=1330018 RepID=A0A167I0C2_CALVF|nr:hypothetical protein CALVIDRAFT_530306 [Calocera viscosa TUFC12733]
MSPFTFLAEATTPHRLRKRSTSPKHAPSAARAPSTPSAIPRLQRRAEETPARMKAKEWYRAETSSSSPTKPPRVKTPYPTRVKRPSTAPTPRTPSASSATSAASQANTEQPSRSPLPASASLPQLDALDRTTLQQLEQLSFELAALTASSAHTPPRKKSVLTRSPRLGNIVEVDTPGRGTPCAVEASREEVLREVGRLGRELRELAW